MAKFWGMFSLTVLILSLISHVLTFIPGVSISMSMVWALHLGAMLVFAPMVFSMQRLKKKQPEKFSGHDIRKYFFPYISRRLSAVCTGVFVYALINFALFIPRMLSGSPEYINGHYELRSHGNSKKLISKDEFDQLQKYLVRGFSGHWIFLSLLPTVYFLKVIPVVNSGRNNS